MKHTNPNQDKIHFFARNFWFAIILVITACQPVNTNRKFTETPATTKTAYVKSTASPPTKNPVTPSPQPTSQINVSESDLQQIKIQFWHTYTGAEAKLINTLIQEFNQDNQWEIEVIPTYQGNTDEIHELINITINITGNIPNIVMGYAYQAQNWDNLRDMVVDVDTYTKDSLWGLSDEQIEEYFPVVWNSDITAGKQWGVPAWRSARVIFYNQGWAEELGFEKAPTTISQFKEQSCRAASFNTSDDIDENDGSGGWVIDTNFSSTLNWINAFGGQVITDTNNGGYQLNSSTTSQAFTFLRDIYEKQCSWQNQSQLPAELLAKRQALFTSAGLSDIPFYEYEFSNSDMNDKWQVIPFPTLSNQQPVITLYGPSYVMLRGEPEEQLAAWIFIKWLTNPTRQAELAMAGYTLPLTVSARDIVREKSGSTYGWKEIADNLEGAKTEPNHPSWFTVRWTLTDATKQLYQWYFETKQIPTLIKLLDKTANEFYQQY